MNVLPTLRRWRGPTLVVQIVALLLGGLIIAQAVTLLLTLVLPPAPTPRYDLRSVATALRVADGDDVDGGLQHNIQPGAPDLGGRGWLTSERSRAELAKMLGASVDDVKLSFYTPLPFAGTVGARKLAMATDGPMMPVNAWKTAPAGISGKLILAQATMPTPPAFPPDGVFPRGQRATPPNRDMLPPDAMPRNPMGRDQMGRNPIARDDNGDPVVRDPARHQRRDAGDAALRGGRVLPGGQQPLIAVDPTPVQGTDGIWIRGDRGEAVPPILRGGTTQATPTPQQTAPAQLFEQQGREQFQGLGNQGFGPQGFFQRGQMGMTPNLTPSIIGKPPVTIEGRTALPRGALNTIIQPVPAAPAAAAPTGNAAPAPYAQPAPAEQIFPADDALMRAPENLTPTADPLLEPEIPLVPRERGLFGLAPSPFVEGDFVAALRLPDGRWSVIQPAPEPFPNAWQRRVLLWFVISFAIVAPVGWLFARRVVKPLVRFAEAAELMGRDPTATGLDLDGPAEVGRAANAFNTMQSRVKSFVGDRTAMIGAISHDLRTPLTRLRFRIEEVDDEGIRDGMIGEVEEMEAMITSVLSFIRDASAPGVREKLDLRTIVEDVAEDALMIGGDVSIGMLRPAPVEVDVMGMRRLLANLIENALKYGTRAHLRLSTDQGEAVAEVIDEGPGVPEDDLERAFEPFYRAANAQPEQRGNGLGLAVCRSIARAHGGDVLLLRTEEGFKAQLRLPLAFKAEETIAAAA